MGTYVPMTEFDPESPRDHRRLRLLQVCGRLPMLLGVRLQTQLHQLWRHSATRQ